MTSVCFSVISIPNRARIRGALVLFLPILSTSGLGDILSPQGPSVVLGYESISRFLTLLLRVLLLVHLTWYLFLLDTTFRKTRYIFIWWGSGNESHGDSWGQRGSANLCPVTIIVACILFLKSLPSGDIIWLLVWSCPHLSAKSPPTFCRCNVCFLDVDEPPWSFTLFIHTLHPLF